MTRKSISINIPAAMLALALVAGCGNSNGTTAPDCANIADWFGTYTVVDSSYDCSTRQASVVCRLRPRPPSSPMRPTPCKCGRELKSSRVVSSMSK